MEINKNMTYIPKSENLRSKVERYEQRPVEASALLCLGALRTVENRFYNGLEQQRTGGIWDEDTKLIRFGVRDYDPEVGRWTSVEPLGFAGNCNWYVYAGNDGVNYLDLDGRNPWLNPNNWLKFYEYFEKLWNKLDPLIKWTISTGIGSYLYENLNAETIKNSCIQLNRAISDLLMSPINIFIIYPSTHGKLNYEWREQYNNPYLPRPRMESSPRRLPYE